MAAKAEAKSLIDQLPEESTTEDILAELYFKKQVDLGLKDVAEGRTVTHDELKRRIVQWRNSAGR